MDKELTIRPEGQEKHDEIVIYQSEDGQVKVDVLFENETVWLTQQQMSMLFQKDRTVITRHISNIFSEGELDEKSNVHFLHFPFSDKPVKFYSLDVIISFFQGSAEQVAMGSEWEDSCGVGVLSC